jgi:SNF2 family DNA or RNA helicase
LQATVAEAGLAIELNKGDIGPLVAWLPTCEGRPIASSPLVSEPTSNGAPAQLQPWEITGLRLTGEQAALLLVACIGRPTLATGVIVGQTLAFWSNAFQFASALVVRQQYLPGVKRQDTSFRAVWQPVVVGDDATRMAQLARAMPGACRSLAESDQAAPGTPAADALSEFLEGTVDALVRRSAPSLPDRHSSGVKRTPTFESVHQQWVFALGSPRGNMEGQTEELQHLADQLQEWRRPISIAAAAPFRLSFRLEEPESEKPRGAKGWQLRYLLQAADDPSLLLPAREAWASKRQRNAVLQRDGFEPREYLLSALGQASALCPQVEQSLKSAAPGGCELDTTAAFDFLTQRSFLLEQAGFGVLLPRWWTRKGTTTRLTARAVIKSSKMRSATGLSLDELLEVEWKIALGDESITIAELQALAKLKTPLVKVRGKWVQLSAEEIQAVLALWEGKALRELSARQALRIALGAESGPGGFEFDGVEASGWLQQLINQLRGEAPFETLPQPDGFRGALRPYQERGYSWLGFLRRWGFGACLADDMGLGKTIQTLALVEREWEPAGKRRPTLLICPMSVVGNWQKEAERFTPDLPVLVHHGGTRIRDAAFKNEAKKHALVLSSYALIHRDFELFQGVPWQSVVLDEAQNIKHPHTKQAQAARAIKADYRIALTGTPVENHVGDLWSIMEFLNPGLLGTQAEFKRTFHIPIQANRDEAAAQRLKRLTGPFILRRLKTDKSIISDLPGKLEMKVFCTLTKEQASLYEAVVQEATEQLETTEGIQRKGLVLSLLSRLKQVCNHPAHFLKDNSPIAGRSGKLARLTEMLEEALSEGDGALIFSQFAEMGGMLVRHLQESFGQEVLFLHGGVAKAGRDRMVTRFQAGDGPRLFVLSLKAGGTGLNLTQANHVFHFDRWWNPAVENQATDRAFRIGQTRNVQVHKFVCLGTLEEKIDAMIEQKQEVAGTVVGTGEEWLTKLSTQELKDLLALREEAFGDEDVGSPRSRRGRSSKLAAV